jgi:hypothetical protein
LVLFEEHGCEVRFYDFIAGITVKRIEIGIRKILKGVTLPTQQEVLLVLDIPKVIYLGIEGKEKDIRALDE